jgi:hypothetical protein
MPGGHLSLSGRLSVWERLTVEASGCTMLVRTRLLKAQFPEPALTGRLLGCFDIPFRDF